VEVEQRPSMTTAMIVFSVQQECLVELDQDFAHAVYLELIKIIKL
jgi:hypothetical protein